MEFIPPNSMKVRFSLRNLCLLFTLTASVQAGPNIVFIMADDMGYGDPAYAGGKVPTPAIDRIANEGMKFTDAHSTSAVCSPTRYSIITGRYSWRSRLKKGTLVGTSEPLIPPQRMTVARYLQDAGYRTGVVGKWHLGFGWEKLPVPVTGEGISGTGWDIDYSKPPSGGPVELGFHESFVLPASLDMAPYVYVRGNRVVGNPSVTKAWDRPGPSTPEFEAVNCLTDFAKESRAFIRRAVDEKKPFFLYLPLTSPHTPVVPSERWKGRSGIGDYGDFLMETDWVVEEVLAELKERKVENETLVIFTSDNGCSPFIDIPAQEKQGHFPSGKLRGAKGDIWEGGHRVPFAVKWPGKIAAGSVSHATISSLDFFATAAELSGADREIPPGAAEDSHSLVPLFTQKDGYGREHLIHHARDGTFAIRQGPWKLCLSPHSGGWSDPKPGSPEARKLFPVQLYHLENDPAEMQNLAEKEPAKVKELAALLAESVRKGRTTAGPEQSNEGPPIRLPGRVSKLLPTLEAAMEK